MRLKTLKIINIFIIFILCFPYHHIYEWLPTPLFSIIFPVNESVWEHMKIIFTACLSINIIECLFIKNENKLTNTFLTATFSIPIYLFIYYPLYKIFNENIFINLFILFITISITEFISYNILKKETKYNTESISVIGIILIYLIFGILTYHPIYKSIFYDTYNKKYGINIYIN